MNFKLWILVILTWPAALWAQWDPETIAWVDRFNKSLNCSDCTKGNLNGPYFSSLWDNVILLRDETLRGGEAPHPGVVKIPLKLDREMFVSPEGEVRPYEVYYWPSVSSSGSAPLIVYLPGIFQDEDDTNTFRAVDLLLKSGYQVIVVPNPLSAGYMNRFPVNAPASYAAEAVVVRSVLRTFLKTQKDISNPTSVHLIGASYGALLGAVVTAQDATSHEGLFKKGKVTLLFP